MMSSMSIQYTHSWWYIKAYAYEPFRYMYCGKYHPTCYGTLLMFNNKTSLAKKHILRVLLCYIYFGSCISLNRDILSNKMSHVYQELSMNCILRHKQTQTSKRPDAIKYGLHHTCYITRIYCSNLYSWL